MLDLVIVNALICKGSSQGKGRKKINLNKLQFPIRKSHLADYLGCHLRTIANYHDFASLHIDDYLEDYPVMQNQHFTGAPLTLYQAWVLIQIFEYLKQLPMKKLLIKAIEINPKFLSKSHFEELYPIEDNRNCQSIQPTNFQD